MFCVMYGWESFPNLLLSQRWIENRREWLGILLIVVVIMWLWKRLPFSLSWLVDLILVLWVVMDLSRPLWQRLWLQIAGPNAPDLAVIAALLPFLSWLINRISKK